MTHEPGVPYVYSNWCYIDYLDGTAIKDGEILEIEWANGEVTREKIEVEKTSAPYQDMGHTNYMPIARAFVVIAYKGAKSKILLVGGVKTAKRVA